MKSKTYIWLIAALAIAMPLSNVSAQDASANVAPDENGPSALATPQLPIGTVARYRVTYFLSSTLAPALRSASIVSVTNQNTATCTVGVDWKVGFGGVVCGTSFALGAGQTADFCTRALPSGITLCNSTCPGAGLTNQEGSATVGSSTTTGCDRIAVSARTVYTQSTSAGADAPVSAITDAKVVRINAGNVGD